MKQFVLITSLVVLIMGWMTWGGNASPPVINLTKENHVVLSGVITDESVRAASLVLHKLNATRAKQTYPIYLVMDTPGGDIESGLRFIESVKTISNLHTITLYAASMGSYIVQALPGDRYIISTGKMMFHRASGGFKGTFESGELESRLSYWKSIVLSLELTNSKRTQLSIERYKELVRDEWWLYGEDNIKKHTADVIVSVTCSDDLTASFHTETVNTFFGPIETIKSNCPLIP